MMNKVKSVFLSDKKFLSKINYNKHGYYMYQKSKQKHYKISVILPCYNAEKTLENTINSVINQTIGFDNIELLLVDDMSEDSTRLLILKYAKTHSNIVPVFLKSNTGSPSIPRNLGIDLAKGKYITFIDSDDWFHKDALQSLYHLASITGDNYVVGKTVVKTDKAKKVVGEYNNWKERKSINPFSIDRIFHHLAPTGRLINTELLKKYNIKFPNMKFAEDKQFFIDVLLKCNTISTTDNVIYYANRYKDNKSLTTTTDIFEKTDTNITLINYVINKNLPTDIEGSILNRLYEFDCITRLFDRGHFLNSKQKDLYFQKFSQVLATTEKLQYDFTQNFYESWHKVLVDFFKDKRYEDIVKLIQWSKKEQIKEYFVENNVPYLRLPFSGRYSSVEIDMLATHKKSLREENSIIISLYLFGKYINEINSLVIRQRNNDLKELELPIHQVSKHTFEVRIPYEKLEQLNKESHSIYVKYLNYKKVFIRMNVRNIINHNKKKLDFYTTIGDNFGLNIK